jgi:hypothetical protein
MESSELAGGFGTSPILPTFSRLFCAYFLDLLYSVARSQFRLSVLSLVRQDQGRKETHSYVMNVFNIVCIVRERAILCDLRGRNVERSHFRLKVQPRIKNVNVLRR